MSEKISLDSSVNASLVPIFRFYAQDRHIFHQTLKNN